MSKILRVWLYIALILISIVLLAVGILFKSKFGFEDFYASIPISVAASLMAGVYTAVFIDLSVFKEKKETTEREAKIFKRLLIHYSLNFCYSFISFRVNSKSHNEPNLERSMHEQFLEKSRFFMDYRKPGTVTRTVKKVYKDLLRSMSYYLKNIEQHALGAISKNDVFSHVNQYVFDLRTIVAEIDTLYDVGREDFVAEQIANIIEELYEFDFIKKYFDKPLKENSNLIVELMVKTKNGQCNP